MHATSRVSICFKNSCFQKEIWSKWSSVKDLPEKETPVENTKKSDLGATLAAHAESQTKAFNQSKGKNTSI